MPKEASQEKFQEFTRERLEMISASKSEVSDEALKLAEQLANIHGKIRVAREASGLHFYLASPACLEQDGVVELNKLHLAMNVEKYFSSDERDVSCAMCMKTGYLVQRFNGYEVSICIFA